MIDLHLHTYYSDGEQSPREVVRTAFQQGIATMAITDHDGTGGVQEAVQAGEALGIRVIPGIEFSTEDPNGAHIHLLGYGIDMEEPELQQALVGIRHARETRNLLIMEALARMGYPVSLEDLEEVPGRDYIGKPVFARAMVKLGYIQQPLDAFQDGRLLRSEEIRKIQKEKISVQRAIHLVRNAGGIPVLAHPLKIGWLGSAKDVSLPERLEKLEGLLKLLISYGLQGIECYYSKHSGEETEALVALAKRMGLLISAGSDYHGPGFQPPLPGLGHCSEESITKQLLSLGKERHAPGNRLHRNEQGQ